MSTSAQTFYCRWDFCPRIFNSVASLRSHFVHDHAPYETATYIPAHKRRRRDDGGWEIVADVSDISAQPNISINMTTMTTMSTRSEPEFVVPSLPASFNYTQDLPPPLGSTGILTEEPVGVDYDAFLRSPSPVASSHPVQSTPLSQIPPESQQQEGTQNVSSISSAQHVSPPRGVFATQAIPPPSATPSSQRTTSSKDTNSPASIQIAFGAAAASGGTPSRRISASGFSWGTGEK